jgi:hypothetical protein
LGVTVAVGGSALLQGLCVLLNMPTQISCRLGLAALVIGCASLVARPSLLLPAPLNRRHRGHSGGQTYRLARFTVG